MKSSKGWNVLLRKLKVLRRGRHVFRPVLEPLPRHGVSQRALVDNVLSVVFGREEVADDAAAGGDGVAANLRARAFGYAVEGFGEVVVGVVADLKGGLVGVLGGG